GDAAQGLPEAGSRRPSEVALGVRALADSLQQPDDGDARHADVAAALPRAAGEAAEKTGAEHEDTITLVDQQLAQELGPLMPLFEQLTQASQQFAPKPPQDPAIQVKQMELEYHQKR